MKISTRCFQGCQSTFNEYLSCRPRMMCATPSTIFCSRRTCPTRRTGESSEWIQCETGDLGTALNFFIYLLLLRSTRIVFCLTARAKSSGLSDINFPLIVYNMLCQIQNGYFIECQKNLHRFWPLVDKSQVGVFGSRCSFPIERNWRKWSTSLFSHGATCRIWHLSVANPVTIFSTCNERDQSLTGKFPSNKLHPE